MNADETSSGHIDGHIHSDNDFLRQFHYHYQVLVIITGNYFLANGRLIL